MPTIRIQDWTKSELESVRELESHSSYDSVVKALLRDRKLVQAIDQADDIDESEAVAPEPEHHKHFDNLTALGEASKAQEGIMFLWCPNCGNEIAHITTENPINISVFEVQCQQCLSELNHHTLVTVEIGYPVEEKVVDNELQSDLRLCVIDYWNRMLEQIGNGTMDGKIEQEYLVWQIGKYYRLFDWEWPTDIPTVGLAPGTTYRNRSTDEYLEVIETASEHQNELDDVHVRLWEEDGDPAGATEKTLNPDETTHLLCTRTLYHTAE